MAVFALAVEDINDLESTIICANPFAFLREMTSIRENIRRRHDTLTRHPCKVPLEIPMLFLDPGGSVRVQLLIPELEH